MKHYCVHIFCGHSNAQGTMPWQPHSASVNPAGTIQASLAARETIPKNNLKFKLYLFYKNIL